MRQTLQLLFCAPAGELLLDQLNEINQDLSGLVNVLLTVPSSSRFVVSLINLYRSVSFIIYLFPQNKKRFLGLGDISNICDVSRDVLQGMYKMPLSRTSNTNWHAMFIFAAASILVVLSRDGATRSHTK